MTTLRNQNQHSALQTSIVTLVLLALLGGCSKDGSFQALSSTNTATSTPSNGTSTGTDTTTAVPTPTPTPSAYQAEPLAWESSAHPERAAWSAAALKIVGENFAVLDKATDITSFCSPYRSLTQDQKINVWADIFAATAYYECGWDPTESSVDVGTSNNKDTWSVGLLQLSVVDQANYGFKFGYTFADLQEPEQNLQLGISIMAKQITNHKVILIPSGGSGLYWATLHPGGRYDASASIEKMVKKLSFCN